MIKIITDAMKVAVLAVIGFIFMLGFAICMSLVGTSPLFLLGGFFFLFVMITYIFTLEQIHDTKETAKLRRAYGLGRG